VRGILLGTGRELLKVLVRCLCHGLLVPVVELLGAYEGIRFTMMELKVSKIWMEGDSAIVVKWIKELPGPILWVKGSLDTFSYL